MGEPWRRKEIIGDATLYLGDCVNVLPKLDMVDAVITDPPYGQQTHEGARTGAGADILLTFPAIDLKVLTAILRECLRLSRRWIVLTCEWRHAAHFEEQGLPLIRCGVWIKPNGAPQFTGDRPATGWEAVAILHPPGKMRWNGGGHPAVWRINKENSEHPTGKPVRLVETWLGQFTDPDETILDPFMGSGTTGVACMNLGRKFIGIEIEEKYFDIACRRIALAANQQKIPLGD